MAVPGSTILELPRDIGGSLGEALGLGVGVGLQQKRQQFDQQQKQQEEFEKEKQKNIGIIDKIINSTLKNSQIEPNDVGTAKFRELSKLAEERTIQTGDPLSALRVTQEYIDSLIQDKGEQLAKDVIEGKPFTKEEGIRGKRGPTKGGRTFIDDLKQLEPQFKRGFTRESVAASLLGNQLTSEEVAAKAIENPTFAQELSEQIGVTAADLPFLAIGGSVGGPVGALALPAFLKSAAGNVWEQIRSEDKFTMAKGGEAALKIANETAKGALIGAFLKRVPGLVPALKRIPGAQKFLDNFIAEKLINIGATTGVLAGVPSALEKRLPTGRDFASALALTLGFETLALPETIRRNIETKGEKTGLTPEEFSKRVQIEAKEKGIDIEKVQAGEGKELQKFNRTVNKIAKEEAKPVVRKAVEIAKEVEKPLLRKEELIKRQEEKVQLVRRAAKSPEKAFEPSIRAEKPPTRFQTEAQILDSFDKIKDEIRSPEKVDLKKVESRAKSDLKFIEQSKAILKRGELPDSNIRGTFIKIKEQYANAYKEMIKFNKEFIRDNKTSDKSRLVRAVGEAEQMNKVLEGRLKRAEADLVIQKNKRAIQKLSQGAKGSFFRNQLKKLRGDIQTLQENIFKQQKVKDALQFKTERVTQKTLKEVQKLSEDFAREKTFKQAEELEKVTGEPKESLKELVDSFGKRTEEAFKKVKEKGQKAEPEARKTLTNETNKLLKRFKKLPRFRKAIVTGFLISAIQNASQLITGEKPSAALISLAFPAGIIGRAGGAAIAALINRGIPFIINRLEADKFKKILQTKNPIIIDKERRKLKEKFSPKRVKEIEELAKAA